MQMQMQAMLLSVQKTVVDGRIYAKAFIALPADGEKDAVTSVMQLGIQEDKADEVFRNVIASGIKLGELALIDVSVVRGSQNSVKQIVTGITSAQRPAMQPAGQQRAETKPEQK